MVMGRSGGTSPSMRQTVVTVADGYEEEGVGELIVEDGVSEENELVESGLTNNILTASEFCAKFEVVMEWLGRSGCLWSTGRRSRKGPGLEAIQIV